MLRLYEPRQDSGKGPLLYLDARVKLILLFTLLIGLALLRSPSYLQIFGYLFFILLIALFGRLSVLRIASASLLVFPFVGFFSLLIYLTGDSNRAWAILAKSYLSALTVLVCTAVTPLPNLISAAAFFKLPQLLLGITQIIYRYLFVLAAQAKTMQVAFRARGGRGRQLTVLASSGMIAVLFSRSYQKAIIVNHAMISRGYSGSLPSKTFAPLKYREMVILVFGLGFAVGLQFI